jgi:hypothetical protein
MVQDKKFALNELKVYEPIFAFSQWSEGKKWYICASFSRYDY